MQKFQVPATIEKIETMSDKSLRLRVDTQELTKEEAAKVFSLHEKLGWFIFSEQELTEEDVKDLPEIKLEEGEKSPSQRLRGALFVLWEKSNRQEPFDIFYRRQLEKWIDQVKAKISELELT